MIRRRVVQLLIAGLTVAALPSAAGTVRANLAAALAYHCDAHGWPWDTTLLVSMNASRSASSHLDARLCPEPMTAADKAEILLLSDVRDNNDALLHYELSRVYAELELEAAAENELIFAVTKSASFNWIALLGSVGLDKEALVGYPGLMNKRLSEACMKIVEMKLIVRNEALDPSMAASCEVLVP